MHRHEINCSSQAQDYLDVPLGPLQGSVGVGVEVTATVSPGPVQVSEGLDVIEDVIEDVSENFQTLREPSISSLEGDSGEEETIKRSGRQTKCNRHFYGDQMRDLSAWISKTKVSVKPSTSNFFITYLENVS